MVKSKQKPLPPSLSINQFKMLRPHIKKIRLTSEFQNAGETCRINELHHSLFTTQKSLFRNHFSEIKNPLDHHGLVQPQRPTKTF